MTTKRIFIIHAWDESPDSCWYQWLKRKLEAQGCDVSVPAMPDPEAPVISTWVATIRDLVLDPDEDTYFIGHSIGCQTILRYLQMLEPDQCIGGALFVAPWTHLMGLEEASQNVAKPWLETPINWQAAKAHCPQFFALFSDNDEWVPQSEQAIFENKLNAQSKVIANSGHFDGMAKLPEVFKLIERQL